MGHQFALAKAHYERGIAAHRAGQLDEAARELAQAMDLAPRQPGFPYTMGLVMQDQGRKDEAVAYYQSALAIDPRLAQAWNNLGLVLHDLGRSDEAIAAIARTLEIKPDYARASRNLASILLDQGRFDAAGLVLDRALALAPEEAGLQRDRGIVHGRQGQPALAEECLRAAVNLAPDDGQNHYHLGECLKSAAKYAEAIASYRAAIVLQPEFAPAWSKLGSAYAECNEPEQAVACYREALARAPKSLGDFLRLHLTLPRVYRSRAHLEQARAEFELGLERVRAGWHAFADLPPDDILAGLQFTNFYLAYQGLDDLTAQTSYGEVVAGLLGRAVPDLMRPRPVFYDGSRRLRVGFVSRFFYYCTVGSYFSSWVTDLDKAGFETYVYHVGDKDDAVTAAVRAAADHFDMPAGGVAAIARRIAAAALDVLIFPDVGMDATTNLLAALCLAPVQCAAWGHPVTTGLANVDYYFSCADMEPADAALHYSECLLMLPGLGTCYVRPVPPLRAERGEFALPEDRTLFLFPQSLFKIHPDNDDSLARILERCPDSLLVVFGDAADNGMRDLLQRWRTVFGPRGLDTEARVRVLPRQSRENYLAVNRVCDVMLDSRHWSGGNTTLDALACGLPVVTLPGRTMRGRQSAAMLRLAGLDELVARHEDDYVALAERLGNDHVWREGMRARTTAGASALFDRREPIRALEAHLRTLRSSRGARVG